MDRRTFLGTTLGAVAAEALLKPATLLALEPHTKQHTEEPERNAGAATAVVKPKDLLATTFDPLAASLLASQAWKPLPRASERAGWMALPQDLRAALVKRADSVNDSEWPMMLATDELEFERTGNRTHFEGLSFGRRAKLGALVLGECCQANGKYLDQIANGVWLICEESFWGVPAHLGAQKAGVGLADEAEPIIELFGAETAAILAWVLYLLPEGLHSVSPLLMPRVRMEAKRRILDPYFERNDFWWMGLGRRKQHLNNWNPWINSNVLTATMLLEPDGPRRGQMVEKICRSVDQFLVDYSADAGCEEGPSYWSRSAASYFDCCRTLVSAHGGKGASALANPFVGAMGRYIANVHIAKDQYVNYGDAHVEANPEPELLYNFGHSTGDELLAEFGAFEAAQRGLAIASAHGRGPSSLSRELGKVFTVAEERAAPRHDALVRDVWYPDLGLMTARETEGSAAGFYVALQAASNGRPHGHNDSGSFLVYSNGEPVFIDVGVEAYTAQTFSKDRYKLWTMQSAFHNLPTIGGVMQHEGDAFRASQLHYERSDAATSVRANLATAYPKEAGVERWMRTLTLDRAGHRVLLEEEFALGREVPVVLTFMAAKEPGIGDGSVRVGDVALHFDPQALRGTSERIALKDSGMVHTWGEAVWRLLLTSAAPVAKGNWKLEMRGA